jgi:hypothetical protein
MGINIPVAWRPGADTTFTNNTNPVDDCNISKNLETGWGFHMFLRAKFICLYQCNNALLGFHSSHRDRAKIGAVL